MTVSWSSVKQQENDPKVQVPQAASTWTSQPIKLMMVVAPEAHQKRPFALFHQRYALNLLWHLAAGWLHQFRHNTSNWHQASQWNGREKLLKCQNKTLPVGQMHTLHYVNSWRLCVNNSEDFRRDMNNVLGKGQSINCNVRFTQPF